MSARVSTCFAAALLAWAAPVTSVRAKQASADAAQLVGTCRFATYTANNYRLNCMADTNGPGWFADLEEFARPMMVPDQVQEVPILWATLARREAEHESAVIQYLQGCEVAA